MFSIGIAGHVDHGKTSLVRALTGIDTDRLPEEKRRGISIEPGFARLQLTTSAGPIAVSLVDLPGHERFVRRMVCGAQGLSALVLVVAADSGVMPQTREHLAIAALLGLQHGLVVVSRCDLVEPDWLPLVEDEIRTALVDTPLADAPLVRASLHVPETLKAVRAALTALVERLPHATADAAQPFWLAVDRTLSVPGHGTVATGNAQQGRVQPGDELEVLPAGVRVRVRGLAQHGQPTAAPDLPGRLALQLAGVDTAQIPPGSWLATPHALRAVSRVDAALQLLPHAAPLDQRAAGLLLVGTADAAVRVVQLSGTPQLPGTTALVQLQLETPLAIPPGSRFLLRGFARDALHGWTLGGGRVLTLEPPRHALGDANVLAALAVLASGSEAERVHALARLQGVRGVSEADLRWQLGLLPAQQARALRPLLASGQLRWAGPHVLTPAALTWLEARVLATMAAFHARQPTQPGLQAAALAAQAVDWVERTVVLAVVAGLVRRGQLRTAEGDVVSAPDFVPQVLVSESDCATVAALLAQAGLAAPTPAVMANTLGWPAAKLHDALGQLVRAGQAQRIAEDYVADAAAVERACNDVRQAFAGQPTLPTSALKDVLGLTRKHLIPFLEYLDASRLTLRTPSGDRVLRRADR